MMNDLDADEVEKIGILRAWEQIGKADMIVVMNDLSRSHELNYSLAQNDLLAAIKTEKNKQTPLIIVNNKLDAVNIELASTMVELNISAKTGEGLLQLKELILEKAGWVCGSNEGVVIARTRHINALQLVNKHLTEALDCISRQIIPLDLLAEECRLAQNELSKLTGIFTSDDLLGEIFSRFCIGK
jgi:tRNA modification GTPase